MDDWADERPVVESVELGEVGVVFGSDATHEKFGQLGGFDR